jgi:hypothetical protein
MNIENKLSSLTKIWTHNNQINEAKIQKHNVGIKLILA